MPFPGMPQPGKTGTLTGLLISPTVEPIEKYPEALISILANQREVELKWDDYKPCEGFTTYAVQIKLPDGSYFRVKVV